MKEILFVNERELCGCGPAANRKVIDLSTVWVKVGVLEKDLRLVAVGQPIEVELAAYPGETFRTSVKAASPVLDPATNLLAVWAELKNPPAGEPPFQPGMAGRASMIGPGRKARASVPAEAVLREGAERFVLVEEANAGRSSEYRKVSVVPVAFNTASTTSSNSSCP